MLEPNDRRVLREALRPPPGYTVDRALATTFSLDLVALLVAPLSFSHFDRLARRDDPGADESDVLGATALLQAVRAHAEKLTVFCQAGSIASPGRYRQLLAYLEGSVVEVVPPGRRGVFHPKVWVQRFVSPTGPVRYRLLVNSRNLTFDRSWDTMLALEGELTERANAFARNHPLGDFLAALPGMAVRPASERVAAHAAEFADEIRRVAFEVPLPFEDELRFWPLGHDGKARWPFDTRIDRLLVVSPFVGADTLGRLTERGSGHVLISRADELAPLAANTLAPFAEVHVLNEGAEVEPEEGEGEAASGAEEAATGLHAKLYVADVGWNAQVWTGSANATRAAFQDNVEILVQLTGKKGKVGIDAMLGADGEGASTLRALLVGYTPPAAPAGVDPVAKALDDRLRKLRVDVASASWKARVEPERGEDGERYRVHLRSDSPLVLGDEVEVGCWPIAVAPDHATPLALSPEGASARWNRLSFQALTSFFAFRVRVWQGQRQAESVFVVNAPLEGAPEHRQARILQAMLDDPAKVMRFLRMLLALDPMDGVDELLDGEGQGAEEGATSWGSSGSDKPILESLLHALDREPARIDDFDRVVRELRSAPGGAALLPAELDQIWVPIREAWEMRSPRGGKR